ERVEIVLNEWDGRALLPRVVLESQPQRRPRAGEARFDGAYRAADDVGNLALGQTLEVQKDDHACVIRQRHECCLDLGGDDFLETIELGIVPEPVVLGGHPHRRPCYIEAIYDGVVALPAVPADKCIPKDSEEPRLEVCAGRELSGCPKRPRVCLLDEVIRVRVLAGEVAGEVMKHVGIPQGCLPQLIRVPGVLENPGALGTDHGTRNNSPMKSGQLMISTASAPRRLKAATPRPSTNVTADRSNRTCPFS